MRHKSDVEHNNIENSLNELDSLFKLKDSETESLGKVLVDSNNEDMNLQNNKTNTEIHTVKWHLCGYKICFPQMSK